MCNRSGDIRAERLVGASPSTGSTGLTLTKVVKQEMADIQLSVHTWIPNVRRILITHSSKTVLKV